MQPRFSQSFLLVLSMLLSLPGAAVLASETTSYTSTSIPAAADTSIAELRMQLKALQARLDALEQQAEPTRNTVQALVASADTQANFKGDLRYRHEAFSIDAKPTRQRHRIRARVSTTKAIEENIEVSFGIATGSSDPVSTNQTLGEGNSSKNLVLDLAYVQWQTPISGLKLRAGKFSNPIMRAGGSGLVWDGDLRPEGLGLTYKQGSLFINAMGSWLRESSSREDSLLYAAQFGSQHNINDDQKIRFGIGYYTITSPQPLFGEPAGNRVNAENGFVSDFNSTEIFTQYGRSLDGVLHGDLTVYASYINNFGADDANTGYAVGAKIKSSQFHLGWNYQRLEADAVFGGLSDSDFIGGGTDGAGHIFEVGYPLTKRVSLRGTLFMNETGLQSGLRDDYNRLMLDISYKY